MRSRPAAPAWLRRSRMRSDGKQYVAFQGGLGRPATTVGPNDAKIDNPPMMFVFALDGKAELPKPAPPPAPNNKPNRPHPEAAPEVAAAVDFY